MYRWTDNVRWMGLTHDAPSCTCVSGDDCTSCRASFTWLDGSPVTNSDGDIIFHSWGNNKPSSGSGCVRVNFDGVWRDIECSNTKRYICERGTTYVLVTHA